MNVPITSREFHEGGANSGDGAGNGAAVSLLADLSLGSTQLGSAGQVGILVPDLDKAIDLYGRLFGIDEWQCYRYDQDFMPWSRFGREEGRFEMDIAMGGSNPQIELIQPLAGPSIYHEFTGQGRMGLHHLGVFVDSLDAAISLMAGAGYGVTQTARGYGLAGDGGFAYFDTDSDLGVVIEAIEIPATRRPGIVRRTGGM
jgi:methylmalonyl-CoA/ethylmalonyl-CoA epimerase